MIVEVQNLRMNADTHQNVRLALIVGWFAAFEREDKKAMEQIEKPAYAIGVICVRNGMTAYEAARECVKYDLTAEEAQVAGLWFSDPGYGWTVFEVRERIKAQTPAVDRGGI